METSASLSITLKVSWQREYNGAGDHIPSLIITIISDGVMLENVLFFRNAGGARLASQEIIGIEPPNLAHAKKRAPLFALGPF